MLIPLGLELEKNMHTKDFGESIVLIPLNEILPKMEVVRYEMWPEMEVIGKEMLLEMMENVTQSSTQWRWRKKMRCMKNMLECISCRHWGGWRKEKAWKKAMVRIWCENLLFTRVFEFSKIRDIFWLYLQKF